MTRQYLPLFNACTNLRSLNLLHAHLIIRGLEQDPLASTKLIESYSDMGSLQSSRLIFDTFQNPDSFMWGVMIKCHSWNGMFQESIFLYQTMLVDLAAELNSFIFPSVLRACSAINVLRTGEKVHTRILKSGFQSDPVIGSSLLSMYGELGCLYNARKVFDEMSMRDVVSWSSMVSIYVQNEQESEGLEIFREMVKEGLKIDSVTLLSVCEACGEFGLRLVGKSAHGYAVRRNIGSDNEASASSLVTMYGKFGDSCGAQSLFYNRAYHSVAVWTSMISCYNQNGYYAEALRTFREMLRCKVVINSVTLMSVVSSCARLGWLQEGKSIHGYAVRNIVNLDENYLRSSLIDMYANCGSLRYSYQVFDGTEDKHLVSWNILISGYTREGMADEALSLLIEMLSRGIFPDSFAFASGLSACGSICLVEFGCQIHSLIIKSHIPNEFVQNSLIDMYSKCGFMNSAFRVFNDIQVKGIVTWNSMICAFSNNSYSKEALGLFDEMYAKYLDMDEVTFLSVIKACSNLGFIDEGKWIHHKLITFGVSVDMYISTALINMYARCGDLQMARRVFDSMSNPNVVSWSAMIGGYSMHGHVDESISLFNRMVDLGIQPNGICFMNILSACRHAGYVERGKFYFKSMVKDFSVMPNFDHYACLVDLLSRSGDLDGAYKAISSMPFKADASVWGALVNGCRIHQRMDFLKTIKKDLVNMDADDSGYYSLLSNVFAEEGKWEESVMVKSKMRSVGLRKVHGYSMIQIE